MTAQHPPLAAGSQFGPYRLDRLIGRGGMGEVYQAYDTKRDRVVAIKVLPGHLAEDEVYRERFRRESHCAARLKEPHVIPIHDYGEIEGHLFIDMRLVEGSNLRAVLRDEAPLAPGRAVDLIRQVAAALDAAHADDLVHRDVKPDNILTTPGGFAYLVDFGIAYSSAESGLTSDGSAVGSFHYMAPERFTSRVITGAADIYALTCVLYECLTGARPFPAGTDGAIMRAHLAEPVPRPSLIRREVPIGFDEVIERGMAKNHAERFATAGELAAAAEAALSTVAAAEVDNAPTMPSKPKNAPDRTVAESARPTSGSGSHGQPEQGGGSGFPPQATAHPGVPRPPGADGPSGPRGPVPAGTGGSRPSRVGASTGPRTSVPAGLIGPAAGATTGPPGPPGGAGPTQPPTGGEPGGPGPPADDSSEPRPTPPREAPPRGRFRRALPVLSLILAGVLTAAVVLGTWLAVGRPSAGTAVADATALRGADVELLAALPGAGYRRSTCVHRDPDSTTTAIVFCDANPAASTPDARFLRFRDLGKLQEYYRTVVLDGFKATSCPGDPPGRDAPSLVDNKEVGRKTCITNVIDNPAEPKPGLVLTNEAALSIAYYFWADATETPLRDYAAKANLLQFRTGDQAADPDSFTPADRQLLSRTGESFGPGNCRHVELPASLMNAAVACATPIGSPSVRFYGFPDRRSADLTYQGSLTQLSGHACGGGAGSDDVWRTATGPVGRMFCAVDSSAPLGPSTCLIGVHDLLVGVEVCTLSKDNPEDGPKTEGELLTWFQKNFG
ncbi:protein kinase [Nocardia sp. NPDC050710]|uniref:serine/threonine-protein kinase n=1 Tax=Nocardia sp. NPDC050710 TaxID=3157220 RepID=UPI0033E512E1